jgi:ATP-dependent helicase HrpA
LPALTRANFDAAVAQSRARIPGLALRLIEAVAFILDLRQQVVRRTGPPPVAAPAVVAAKPRTFTDFNQLGVVAAPAPVVKANPVAVELGALLPARFLESLTQERLAHLPRYLKGLLTRAERAVNNPGKDAERAGLVRSYAEAYRQLCARTDPTPEGRLLLEEFRWLLEEFKVSLFAQELGTATPVSAKRLDELLGRVRAAL